MSAHPAFFPSAVRALKNTGLQITQITSEEKNPVYSIKYSDAKQPIVCFSKKYDHSHNPSERMIAVMTCSNADENCPYIPYASKRVAVRYEDPKVADGTPQQQDKYDERSLQIATEMFFVMSLV